MFRSWYLSLVCIICVVVGSGCATIVNSGPDAVYIVSNPPGAAVAVDGANVGLTPLTTMVSRSANMVTFSKEGYQSVSLPVQKDFNVWVLGNLFWSYGFVIGLIVDGVAGNFSEVSNTIVITLSKLESGDSRKANGPGSIAAWLDRMRKYSQLAQADPPE